MWQLLILILVILLVYTTARMKRDSKTKLDSPNTEMVKCNACDLHLPASEAIENDDGWFLMRASNTQNQLTCRAESTSQEGLKSLIAIIENQLSLSGVNYKFTV